MPQKLEKIYDPLKVESKWYNYWIKNHLFHAVPGTGRKTYTIVIPPPNVTGMLTMGHILNNTIQDLLVRWKRMDNYEALWLPGTDHAGIATQNKVEASLKDEGLTRHDLGREKLIQRVWKWKEKFGGIILEQLKRLGASCDWERTRFTMDEGLSEAVREVFVRLYEKGLIYRGKRLINWCPRCHTALADEEAPNKEMQGTFWHIAYPLSDGSGEIVVSTTRPETLLGDTAVAVHPDDERYAHLIGRKVTLPLVGREIPIIADEHADMEKGSGAVKITPAHDFDDFAVAERHGLEKVAVIDDNGNINEAGGGYSGLDRFEARNKIVADLKEAGLFRGEEPRITPIPSCYRCDTIVEPYLSEQWFVKMKPLAEPAIAAVRSGKIRFCPKHWEETYFHWMENIRDWCISRQIWWGHRIPVWTCENGHTFAARRDPVVCDECGSSRLTQDPDVLDTWFSSWLWPFSTLGWPERTDDLAAFFPTDTLVTGPDIIFFWVARMIMAALEFMGDVPFTDVYFNGMIRDLAGRKMSKSLGNSPDPLWLIEGADAAAVKEFAAKNPSYKSGVPAYGADAVRLTMVYLTPLGGDIHFDHTLVEMGQKFCNKIWNASRFVLMNLPENVYFAGNLSGFRSDMELPERWILSRLQKVIGEVRQGLESFRLNEATKQAYAFVWGEFCDWYIEMLKPRFYGETEAGSKAAVETAVHIMETILRLLHPFMPFITEEIWQALPLENIDAPGTRSIMIQPYPEAREELIDEEAEKEMKLLQECIGAIRAIRGEMNIPQEKKATLLLSGEPSLLDILKRHEPYIKRLAGIETVKTGKILKRPPQSASAVVGGLDIFLPLEGLVDLALEKSRIIKEIERLEKQVEGLKRKLSNKDFIDKAPADVVEKEHRKESDFSEKLDKLKENLKHLAE